MPLNIDFQQIFLHLMNFTLLFAILYFILYKPVQDFMAKREEYYANMDKEATENLAASIHDKEEYAARLKAVEEEILEERDKARKDLEETYKKRVRQAEEEASKILVKARAEAEREKTNIINDAQGEISEMVTAATEKILLRASASDAFEQFLDAAEGGNGDEIFQ